MLTSLCFAQILFPNEEEEEEEEGMLVVELEAEEEEEEADNPLAPLGIEIPAPAPAAPPRRSQRKHRPILRFNPRVEKRTLGSKPRKGK